jgi:ribosomal protein S18 acetylase RimI-like enzyme
MIDDYDLEYTDKDIAIEMKLAYLFYNETKNNEYLSGAMLQGKRWFDLFLNRHSLEFVEKKYNKVDAITIIKNSVHKLMIGMNLKTGKHARVYCPSDTQSFRFFNPHYENDGAADFFDYSEQELLDLLDDEVTIGYIIHNPKIVSPEFDLYDHSIGYLDKYVVDIIEFCSELHTTEEIMELRESLFAGLLLSPIPLLEFEGETELVGCLRKLQMDFINALRLTKTSIRLLDYLDPIELNTCVRKYKEAITKNKLLEGLIIRKATVDDAEGKGYVHYQSWIETYTGLFPDEVMQRLSLEKSIDNARKYPENTYVAVVDNNIVGFSCYLESRDEDLEDTGEIMAIYILKEYQGFGIGKKLMEVCYKELSQYSKLSLWVLGSNKKSVGFYERQGFVADGKTKMLHGKEVIRMVKDC